jgi:hypothetical protein
LNRKINNRHFYILFLYIKKNIFPIFSTKSQMSFSLKVPEKSIGYSLEKRRNIKVIFQRLLQDNKSLRDRLAKQTHELELCRWELKKMQLLNHSSKPPLFPKMSSATSFGGYPSEALNYFSSSMLPMNGGGKGFISQSVGEISNMDLRKSALEDAQRRKRDLMSRSETQSVISDTLVE